MTDAPAPREWFAACRRGWFAACRSDRLEEGRILARTIAGRPIALFRGSDGLPIALEDRCPHRNAPLSLGRIRDGHVECGYHGWRFGAGGRCAGIPGLAAEALASRGRDVPSLPARDAHGLTWIAPLSADGEPHRPRHLDMPGWITTYLETIMPGTMADTIENVLDVPHTAFLHGGLFRKDGARVPVELIVRRGSDRVEAEFVGEPRPTGLMGRLLSPRGGVVTHVDRFVMPCVAEVEYGVGSSRGILATHLFTPIDASITRVLHVIGIRLPAGALLGPLIRLFGRRIVAQDARMLAAQSTNMARFGGKRFASTELDVLGAHVRQLLDGTGSPQQERRVTMML
jgi:phenylpropionate dioxygenase-like ring-hydroxylating dioxygenase large terminal subunit